jgi:DNA-binding response OmpR family regulator
MAENDGPILVAAPADTATEYESWLEEDWSVETVTGVEDLLETADPDVGVVLLDADLPDSSPEQVLDDLRSEAIDRPVVVVRADEPAADSVGLRFSEYLVKPVDEAGLRATVEAMAVRTDEDVQKQEYVSLAATQAAMDLELSPDEKSDSEAYTRLTDRIDSLRERADVPIDELKEQVDG